MYWQEAIRQSPQGMATRAVGNTVYRRDSDGNTVRARCGVFCRVSRSEVEGYNDWLPVKAKKGGE